MKRVMQEHIEHLVGAEGEYDGHAQSFEAYLNTISQKPLLSPAEERRLARKVREGCPRAKDELVKRNLLLVVHNAKRYRGLGVDFEELVQEGTFGLIRAAEKFEPEKGFKFSTYATWWIRQAAGRAVADKSRTIRIPVHYQEKLAALREAERSLAAGLGRDATKEELANEIGVEVEKVADMLRIRQSVASVDAPANAASTDREDDDAAAVVSFLADEEQSEEVSGEALSLLSGLEIRRALAKLSDNERWVVQRRYGLDGRPPATLREIADEKGTVYQHIARVNKRALGRLAAILGGRKLDEWVA